VLAGKLNEVIAELNKREADDGYSLEDFKSGKVQADIVAVSGASDVVKGEPAFNPEPQQSVN
jgi:NAD/NADP transhydrogenase beta subunit